jgi:hypothetical protein
MSVGRAWRYLSGAVEWYSYVLVGIVEISDGGTILRRKRLIR